MKTAKACTVFLRKHPEIRTRHPSQNRLQIHAGDWQRYWADQDRKGFDALGQPAEEIDAIIQGQKARQAGTRKQKSL